MKFLTSLLFAITASAMPASIGTLSTDDDVCCCCNISIETIVCMPNKSANSPECICPMVLCPEDAPTSTIAVPEPTVTPEDAEDKGPEPPEGMDWCCCCNAGSETIDCGAFPSSDGCFCPQVMCPADAETVYPPLATNPPKTEPEGK